MLDKIKEDLKKAITEFTIEDFNIYTMNELYMQVANKTNEVIEIVKLLQDYLDEQIFNDVENIEIKQQTLENVFNQLIINAGNSNAEIVDARIEESGKTYYKLKDRLNNIDNKIEDYKYKKILFDLYKTPGKSNNEVLNIILSTYKDEGIEILFAGKEYIFDDDIIIDNNLADEDYAKYKRIKLTSKVKSTFLFNNTSDNYAITVGKDTWQYESTNNYAKGYLEVELNNIIFRNNSNNKNKKGIYSLNTRRIRITECEITDFIEGVKLQGSWDMSEIVKTKINYTGNTKFGTGINVTNGSNALKISQCSLFNNDISILIQGDSNLTGSIHSLWIKNNDFESSNTSIKLNPLTTNIGSIVISENHFEYNNVILEVINNSTIWGINFEKCVSLGYGKIKIGDSNYTNEIKYFNIDNCSFLTNKTDDYLDFGSSIKEYLVNCYIGKIAIYGDYEIKKPVAHLRTDGNKSIYNTMPLYDGSNDTPTARGDLTKGVTGEIRWDERNLYIKRNNTWGIIPVQQRNTYERNKNYRLTGIINVPAQSSIGAWSSVDIPLTINGIVAESGYVINLHPAKFLEGSLQYSYWISSNNTVNLRLTNISSSSVTTSSQNWFYIIELIDN